MTWPATTPISSSISLAIDLTPDDMAAYQIWCEFHRPAARMRRRRLRRRAAWGAALAMASLAVMAWALSGGLARSLSGLSRIAWPLRTSIVIAGIAIAALSVIGSLLSPIWLVHALAVFTAPGERRFERTLRNRAASLLPLTPLHGRVTIGPGGVRTESDGRVDETPWEAIAAIHETPTLLVFVGREGETDFLPRRAFGDGLGGREQVAMLVAMASAAGAGQAGTLYPMLRDRDLKCPECGYNLRGLEAPRCPECGVAIEMGTLRVARQRRGWFVRRRGEEREPG